MQRPISIRKCPPVLFRWLMALALVLTVSATSLCAAETPSPPPPPTPAADNTPPVQPPPDEPATILPDAVPPGEVAPWDPEATPPTDSDAMSPPTPVAPATQPAPATAETPKPSGDLIAPADQPLDLSFLDFLVPKHPRPTWRVGGMVEMAATAGIDETRATVGTQALEGFVGYKEWRLRYKRNFFDWDLNGSSVFPSFPGPAGARRDPWSDLNTLGLAWFRFGRWKPKWFYMLGAGANATFERELKDCFAGFAMGSLVYQPDAHWKFNFGLLVAVNRIHVLPLPMIGFSYRKDSPSGWFVQIGFPELLVGYRFNERWMVSTKFIEGDGETWRLADDNPVAHGGYLETKGAKTGLDCEWKPRDNLTVTFAVKYLFSRQWTVRSSSLKHKQTINLNPALSSQCQLEWSF